MTKFFKSPKIATLLRALPPHVASDIHNQLGALENDHIAVSVYSTNPLTARRFTTAFFIEPVSLSCRKKDNGEVYRLYTYQAGCFTTQQISDVAAPRENETKLVFWVINADDHKEGDVLERPDIGNHIIPILNHSPDAFKTVKDTTTPGGKQAEMIKRTMIRKNMVVDICLENEEGLDKVAQKFVKRYPGEQQIFAAHVIKERHLGVTLKNQVVGSYAAFIARLIRRHFNTCSEEKRNDINALIQNHLGDELKLGGVALVTNVAGAVFSGLGSLFRAFKGK